MVEMERSAHYNHLAEQERSRAIAQWLRAHPEIGVLNGGKFYKIVDNEMVFLEPLS
jgi:hypothetical protein